MAIVVTGQLKGAYTAILTAVCLTGALLTGCSPKGGSGGPGATPISFSAPSPLVGKWSGKSKLATGDGLAGMALALAGDQLVGPSTVTLQADGTGYLKVAKLPERPIGWTQDGRRVILSKVGGMDPKSGAEKANDTAVATLSDGDKDMTIDLGQLTVVLTKDPAQ